MNKSISTATDRLSNVLDVVELGKRTGMLRVERGQGTLREDGEIYFINGNPIYAALAGLRGRDALHAMVRWAECYFTFDTQSPQPIPNVSGVLPAVNVSQGAPRPQEYPLPSGPFPVGQPSGGFGNSGPMPYGGQMYPQGAPNEYASGANWGAPNPFQQAPQPYPGQGYGAPGFTPSGGNPFAPTGGGPFAPSGGSAFANSGVHHFPQQGFPPQAFPAPNTPFNGNQTDPSAMRRPRRTPDMRDLITVVSTYNLTRSHRNMLVLADGDHTVADLSQLSGKPAQEVQELLHDLEGLSLIVWV